MLSIICNIINLKYNYVVFLFFDKFKKMEEIHLKKKPEIESNNPLNENAIVFNEKKWTVTLPKTTLANLWEALSYLKELEQLITYEMRKSNEYVVKEITDILNNAFNWWYNFDRIDSKNWHNKSDVCNDHSYDSNKSYYVEKPLKFLSEYEWDLWRFMDSVAQEIKLREMWWWEDFNNMCKRFWVSKDELEDMDTVSLIQKIKEDINNIHLLTPITYRLWVAKFYLSVILKVCEDFWYKG